MATTKITFSTIFFLGCLTSHLVAQEGKKDQTTFENQLSPYARTLFTRLSPDQKERAMDDKEASPDDAVARASFECKKLKK